MPKDPIGIAGENLAVQFLERHGYRIIIRNFTNKLGEIDIIARQGDTICFIEVKTRQSSEYGNPLEAITPAKQRKLTRLALSYIQANELEDQLSRFDVVAIDLEKPGDEAIELIDNAFEAEY